MLAVIFLQQSTSPSLQAYTFPGFPHTRTAIYLLRWMPGIRRPTFSPDISAHICLCIPSAFPSAFLITVTCQVYRRLRASRRRRCAYVVSNQWSSARLRGHMSCKQLQASPRPAQKVTNPNAIHLSIPACDVRRFLKKTLSRAYVSGHLMSAFDGRV